MNLTLNVGDFRELWVVIIEIEIVSTSELICYQKGWLSA